MKIALLGYGVEGVSAYHYFKHLYPDAEFEVYDNAETPKYDLPEGVVFRGGVKDFYDIDADLVMRTPAIAPAKVSSRGRVSSVTREFFDVCPLPIIGITGTKGKGTTATLTANMLTKAGIKTWLVGNIGLAALDVVEEIKATHAAGEPGVVVYELSSFQLWDMEKSPHVAIVLMIEPEHLNVHDGFDDYVSAKSNIAKHQTVNDITIYYADNETSVRIAEMSPGKKIPYRIPESGSLEIEGQKIAEARDIKLFGAHNVGNVQAAMLAAWQFTQDTQALREAIREFTGLPHRLEPVGVKNGVLYVNDSFSSAPPATVAAIKAFAQPKVVIMGGYDRGLDFSKTVEEIVKQPQIKYILLIGETKHRIAQAFEAYGWHKYEVVEGGLQEATVRAWQLATSGDVVILSPGCASFDMFKDFMERGDEFKRLVGGL